MSAGAIMFLNPGVILQRAGPTWVNGQPIYGLRDVPPQPNGSVDRLNELARMVAGGLVLTSLEGFGDPRAALYKLGPKVGMPPAWHTEPLASGPAASIAGWLAANGPASSIVIDRPGVSPIGGVRIDVPADAEITAHAVRVAAAALAAF